MRLLFISRTCAALNSELTLQCHRSEVNVIKGEYPIWWTKIREGFSSCIRFNTAEMRCLNRHRRKCDVRTGHN